MCTVLILGVGAGTQWKHGDGSTGTVPVLQCKSGDGSSTCILFFNLGTFSLALEMVENSSLVTRDLRDGTYHVHRLDFGSPGGKKIVED